MTSLYEALGLPVNASCHEIKAAYRKLVRRCHPDVVIMNRKETSANEFMKIHSTYSTLSDPDKRAQYDKELYRNLLTIQLFHQLMCVEENGRLTSVDSKMNVILLSLVGNYV